jgi:hypothetical protein
MIDNISIFYSYYHEFKNLYLKMILLLEIRESFVKLVLRKYNKYRWGCKKEVWKTFIGINFLKRKINPRRFNNLRLNRQDPKYISVTAMDLLMLRGKKFTFYYEKDKEQTGRRKSMTPEKGMWPKIPRYFAGPEEKICRAGKTAEITNESQSSFQKINKFKF